MADTTTTNYGWVKPDLGASDDTWGGKLNADLDGVDSVVHGVQVSVPAASSTAPIMDGTAAVGAGTTFARADHVHPTDTSRLALSGGTLTGPLTLAADPAAALGAATKQYVDGGRLGDNRIINGDMRIDQRWNGASETTTNVYTCDRWTYAGAQLAKGSWQRIATSLAPGFPYALGFTSSSAYTAIANDYFNFNQPIEADFLSDFQWGTANAQPATVSFWANSSLTGTFSGAIRNGAVTRSYPFSFSLPNANTWTKISLTIPGDTAGTWTLSGNGVGIYLNFDLGAGSTLRGPANAWASTNYSAATGAVSLVASNGATFYVTGVKLEVGSLATPFNRQSLANNLADCQRYYQAGFGAWIGYAAAGQNGGYAITLQTQMRATPTIVFSNQGYNNASAISAAYVINTSLYAVAVASTTGGMGWTTNFTAEAEL